MISSHHILFSGYGSLEHLLFLLLVKGDRGSTQQLPHSISQQPSVSAGPSAGPPQLYWHCSWGSTEQQPAATSTAATDGAAKSCYDGGQQGKTQSISTLSACVVFFSPLSQCKKDEVLPWYAQTKWANFTMELSYLGVNHLIWYAGNIP